MRLADADRELGASDEGTGDDVDSEGSGVGVHTIGVLPGLILDIFGRFGVVGSMVVITVGKITIVRVQFHYGRPRGTDS